MLKRQNNNLINGLFRVGLFITFLSLLVFCGKETKTDVAQYQCPMDCELGKTYSEQGSCPVCKMDLVKVEDTEQANERDDGEIHRALNFSRVHLIA